jgi:excisionase family DNA binding protein
MEQMLTEQEAAKYLNISVHKLREDRYLANGHKIAYYKIGRLVRYKETDLEKFINENRQEPTNGNSSE